MPRTERAPGVVRWAATNGRLAHADWAHSCEMCSNVAGVQDLLIVLGRSDIQVICHHCASMTANDRSIDLRDRVIPFHVS